MSTAATAAKSMQDEAVQVLERLSALIMDGYVETDESVGPGVSAFSASTQHLELISTQLRSLRNAASEANAAHVQMSVLAGSDANAIPSLRVFGERQETLAQLAQQLAVEYDQFIAGSVNRLEGQALVATNKYKSFCNKTVELRRRKAQLQLLVRQKERSCLRTLERSLIPAEATDFTSSMEGAIARLSPTTRIWWECYARLDAKRKVLLFTSRKADSPQTATKAVALSKYALAHELQETFVGHAAAFELVPHQPDLPTVVLAADGSMMARKWVYMLQQAIDSDGDDTIDAHPSYGEGVPPMSPLPAYRDARTPSGEGHGSLGASSMPVALKPIARSLEQLYDFSAAKIDELDQTFSGTLAEQAARIEALMAQMSREKEILSEVVVAAMKSFQDEMQATMAAKLLQLAEAQREYHSSAAAQMASICASLREMQPRVQHQPSVEPASPAATTNVQPAARAEEPTMSATAGDKRDDNEIVD